ncbi:MAG TPA: protein kinase [Candidatus Eisenbacteria bacterium]|nr:protein kinase [Candidatus Eisenbacteria bacterium]
MIGELFGRYRVVAPLASGGMSEVWKADDELRGSPVALKLLAAHLLGSVTERKRFLGEARTAMNLSHPGIVDVLEVGERENQPWMAMGYIEGEPLSDAIARSPLTIHEALRIAASAADALAFAHERGVIHRDVKSRNIMLTRDGRVVVIDFGIAIVLGEDPLTTTGKMVGTIACLAPEVITGRRADERSDIYGIGIVLYESLTGVLPYRGEHMDVVRYAIVNEPLVSPHALRAGIPEEVEQVVVQALARTPGDRPQTMKALAARLRELMTSSPEKEPSAAGLMLTPELGPRPVHKVLLGLLPFESSSETETPELRSFVRGLADVLATDLSAVPGLTVISPERLAEDDAPPSVLARRIGANRLLGGQVQEIGGVVRVHWWISDPFTGVRVAGGREEADARKLFELEDKIRAALFRALDLYGTTPTVSRVAGDPAAREKMTQASGYLRRHDDIADVDAAIAILEKLQASGAPALSYALLARAYSIKHRLTNDRVWDARAAAACDKAKELDPNAPEVLLMVGELRLAAGHPDQARECFELSLAARITPEAWIGMARTEEATQQLDRAEVALERAVAAEPQWWGSHDALAHFFSRHGRFEEAIASWRRVLSLTPDNARAHSRIASVQFRMGRIEEAAESCERAIAIRPEARSFANWGTALFYLRRYEESAEAFERAVALEPLDAMSWGHLGSACRLIPGHEARATEALERAILQMRERLSRNPADAENWGRLAGWLSNLYRKEESTEAIERALALAPHHVDILVWAVGVYQRFDPARAMSHLKHAVELGHSLDRFIGDPALAPLRATPEFQSMLGSSLEEQGSQS